MNKNIFTFSDRSYDPIKVRRHLLIYSQNQFSDWVSKYNEGSEVEQANAEELLISVSRKAFNLPEVTEQGGVDDGVVLDLLAAYLEWLSVGPSVSTETSRISRPCTDCHPAP